VLLNHLKVIALSACALAAAMSSAHADDVKVLTTKKFTTNSHVQPKQQQ
jgi:hypothetical protein